MPHLHHLVYRLSGEVALATLHRLGKAQGRGEVLGQAQGRGWVLGLGLGVGVPVVSARAPRNQPWPRPRSYPDPDAWNPSQQQPLNPTVAAPKTYGCSP